MYSSDGGVVSYNKWGWSNWYKENTKATYACGFGYKNLEQTQAFVWLQEIGRNLVTHALKVSVFFLFCIRLAELVQLGEFNKNQSSMTKGY